MRYIKLSTLEYPRHEGDIRREHPEIKEEQTWPNFPCPSTYAYVEWVDPPQYDANTQVIYETSPVYSSNNWMMQWTVRDMTSQEMNVKSYFDKHHKYPPMGTIIS